MLAGRWATKTCLATSIIPQEFSCASLGGSRGQINAFRPVDIPDYLATNPSLTARLEKKKKGASDALDHAPRNITVRALCMTQQWIYTNTAAFPYNHMATIAGLDERRLIAAWQTSPIREGASGQYIVTSVSKDGGRTWMPPRRLEGARGRGGYEAPVWGPALMRHPNELIVRLFFSASQSCKSLQHDDIWKPGGDIMVMTTLDGDHWTPPTIIYKQEDGGGIPKVVANPPLATSQSRVGTPAGLTWYLPYWNEMPKYSTCQVDPDAQAGAATLVKRPSKASWTATGNLITSGSSWLIEPSIVTGDAPNRLVQFFRTSLGRAYRSVSTTGGRSWGPATPTRLPNPNSKMHAIRLTNGALVAAHNNHESRPSEEGTRTLLFVSISTDEGYSWETLAQVETQARVGSRFHYPTLMQRGCDLLVIYSVSHVIMGDGGEQQDSRAVPEGGIRLATISLALD